MKGHAKFPRQERLTKTREYQEVYRKGTRWVGRAFVCYVVQRQGQGRRFGMAVSRRVGGAVVRNRVKRYIRETYRTQREHLIDDFSMVVVARHAAASMSYGECEAAIGGLFRKGHVLRD